MVCSEWWAAHIIPFPGDKIPLLLPLSRSDIRNLPPHEDTGLAYPSERQDIAGCPVAVLEQEVVFPPPTMIPLGTFENQTSENLYVNMMPILGSTILLAASLPACCQQYKPIIEKCLQRLQTAKSAGSEPVVYLTIDERPVQRGESQRRGGVHVESPGILPLHVPADGTNSSTNGIYIPGAEHHWGQGMMMRTEVIQGGIFMASNVSDSCAVWNCHIHDPEGDVVGPHGDIRRLADLLGPPSMQLAGGDLVWMSDKTPHQSLPLRQDTHRQYFRLVTGPVTSWFADHSTANPLWTAAEHEQHLQHVNVVRGNKFDLYRGAQCCKWNMGLAEELTAAQKLKQFRVIFNAHGLGALGQNLTQEHGICSISQLLGADKNRDGRDARALANSAGGLCCNWYNEMPKLRDLIRKLNSSTSSS